jgi:hypothetical protein
VVLNWPDGDSCVSKHVALNIVESNNLLCLLKITKLNTLTEHNGMELLKVESVFVYQPIKTPFPWIPSLDCCNKYVIVSVETLLRCE